MSESLTSWSDLASQLNRTLGIFDSAAALTSGFEKFPDCVSTSRKALAASAAKSRVEEVWPSAGIETAVQIAALIEFGKSIAGGVIREATRNKNQVDAHRSVDLLARLDALHCLVADCFRYGAELDGSVSERGGHALAEAKDLAGELDLLLSRSWGADFSGRLSKLACLP